MDLKRARLRVHRFVLIHGVLSRSVRTRGRHFITYKNNVELQYISEFKLPFLNCRLDGSIS